MKGMGHKKGKGGVPLPKVKCEKPSQGSKFEPQGSAAKGTSEASYSGTNGSD